MSGNFSCEPAEKFGKLSFKDNPLQITDGLFETAITHRMKRETLNLFPIKLLSEPIQHLFKVNGATGGVMFTFWFLILLSFALSLSLIIFSKGKRMYKSAMHFFLFVSHLTPPKLNFYYIILGQVK